MTVYGTYSLNHRHYLAQSRGSSRRYTKHFSIPANGASLVSFHSLWIGFAVLYSSLFLSFYNNIDSFAYVQGGAEDFILLEGFCFFYAA